MAIKNYGDDDFVVSELGNWNVAAEYSKLKIMKPLYLADEYQTIAQFGTVEFIDELSNPVEVDTLKIKGLARLLQTLIMIIDNCNFAIKHKTDKETLKNYRIELVKYNDNLSKLYSEKRDVRTGTKKLKVNKELYTPSLNRIIELKSLINIPLNKSDLIFTHREEFDYNALKEAQIKELTTRG